MKNTYLRRKPSSKLKVYLGYKSHHTFFGDKSRKYKKNRSISSPESVGGDEIEQMNQKDLGLLVNYFKNENVTYMLGLQESLVNNDTTYNSCTIRTNLKY